MIYFFSQLINLHFFKEFIKKVLGKYFSLCAPKNNLLR